MSVYVNQINPDIASSISFSYLNASETAYNVITLILIVIVEGVIINIAFVAVIKDKGDEIGCRKGLI